jgi:polysaccharide biosynthesis transport protein
MPEQHNVERSLATLSAVAPPDNYRVAWVPGEPAPEEASVPLSQYLWILRRNKWRILAFMVAAVAGTLAVSSRITPVYESTAAIDIDRRVPTGVLGPDSSQASTNDADQFLATQVKLIQSDSVLRPVNRKLHLIEAEGAGRVDGLGSADAEDAPVLLKKLRVTRPPNTYLLLVSYRSTQPRLAAEAANAIAQSYLEHTYNIRYRSAASLSSFMEKQLEELKAKMEGSSGAVARFERELNVINPEEKTTILSSRLLQLNTEYTNAQADRVRKESAWNSARTGTLEAAQVSTQGESLQRLSEKLNEAQAKFADITVRYGQNHPEYRKAAAQVTELQRQLDGARANIARRVEIEYRQSVSREGMLEKAVAQTKAEFDRLNSRSFQYQTLKREAEADKKLYEELVTKIKEASINSGFQNSAIRIADPARPALKPVSPNLKLNLLLAFLCSGLLAVGVAVLSDVLDNTVRDPEQVSRALKAEVIGNLPVVKTWRGRLAPVAPAEKSGLAGMLMLTGEKRERAYTTYDEAIRTLRNSILLADFERNLHSLLVTSAMPAEGKSTVAAHLAIAHAEQGHKTLLIDADLRRPSVHKRFDVPGAFGLSSVLLSDGVWQPAVIRYDKTPALDILPAGPASRRAADLVGDALLGIVEEASQKYDLVVVDAPPLLGFAEPLQLATAVDGVIVVARAGETNRKAVASVLATLERLRANLLGLVLNEVHKDTSDSYSHYGYYGKYHEYYNPKERRETAC